MMIMNAQETMSMMVSMCMSVIFSLSRCSEVVGGRNVDVEVWKWS